VNPDRVNHRLAGVYAAAGFSRTGASSARD
jgi:hypothetical protein